MKACLQQQPMSCSKEESTDYLKLQQNEKSTQKTIKPYIILYTYLYEWLIEAAYISSLILIYI